MERQCPKQETGNTGRVGNRLKSEWGKYKEAPYTYVFIYVYLCTHKREIGMYLKTNKQQIVLFVKYVLFTLRVLSQKM